MLWWLFVLAFAFGNVLLHKRGNETAGKLIGIMGMTTYLWSARLLAVIGVLVVSSLLGRNLLRSSTRLKTFLIFVPIAVILDLSLISVPIERIHYVQYGFLTWLGYKAMGKQLPAAMMAFVVAVLDEAYQYWILYAKERFVYFDWNDIVLNLIGALIVLLFFLPIEERAGKMPAKSVLAAVILWTLTSALFVFVLNPDHYLVRDDPYKGTGSFWITSNINTNYHVMNTLEGLVFLGVILILTIGYHLPSHSPGWRNWQTHRT